MLDEGPEHMEKQASYLPETLLIKLQETTSI